MKRQYKRHIQVSQPNGNNTLLLTKTLPRSEFPEKGENIREVFLQDEEASNLYEELDKLKTSWDEGNMRHPFKTFLHARDYFLEDYFLN